MSQSLTAAMTIVAKNCKKMRNQEKSGQIREVSGYCCPISSAANRKAHKGKMFNSSTYWEAGNYLGLETENSSIIAYISDSAFDKYRVLFERILSAHNKFQRDKIMNSLKKDMDTVARYCNKMQISFDMIREVNGKHCCPVASAGNRKRKKKNKWISQYNEPGQYLGINYYNGWQIAMAADIFYHPHRKKFVAALKRYRKL